MSILLYDSVVVRLNKQPHSDCLKKENKSATQMEYHMEKSNKIRCGGN